MRSWVTILQRIWEILREASGENDYERYAQHARGIGEQPVTPQAFYLRQLEHKHSRPTRCC
jgi:Selenoprotein, putative